MSANPIVLATDGSPSAAEATLEAIALARALGTHLVVISVDRPVSVGRAVHGYGTTLADVRKTERDRTEVALTRACAAAVDAGVECQPVHAGESPDVAGEIRRAAGRHSARMIVIGAHGWSALRRAWHGSVSTAVVREARCPVLVVPSRPSTEEQHPHRLDARERTART